MTALHGGYSSAHSGVLRSPQSDGVMPVRLTLGRKSASAITTPPAKANRKPRRAGVSQRSCGLRAMMRRSTVLRADTGEGDSGVEDDMAYAPFMRRGNQS